MCAKFCSTYKGRSFLFVFWKNRKQEKKSSQINLPLDKIHSEKIEFETCAASFI